MKKIEVTQDALVGNTRRVPLTTFMRFYTSDGSWIEVEATKMGDGDAVMIRSSRAMTLQLGSANTVYARLPKRGDKS